MQVKLRQNCAELDGSIKKLKDDKKLLNKQVKVKEKHVKTLRNMTYEQRREFALALAR